MEKRAPNIEKVFNYATTAWDCGVFCNYSDNNHNFLILGDKRPYLSLPRPGVSIPPPALMNIPALSDGL